MTCILPLGAGVPTFAAGKGYLEDALSQDLETSFTAPGIFGEPSARHVKVITLGSWNRLAHRGFWSAELIWIDDGDELRYEPIGARSQDSDNIQLDILAILHGLQRAVELGLPAQIFTAVEANALTIPQYFPTWRENGWSRGNKGRPKNLELWQKVGAICETHDVEWFKRPRDRRDGLIEYEELRSFLEDQQNTFWAQRAANRDRR